MNLLEQIRRQQPPPCAVCGRAVGHVQIDMLAHVSSYRMTVQCHGESESVDLDMKLLAMWRAGLCEIWVLPCFQRKQLGEGQRQLGA